MRKRKKKRRPLEHMGSNTKAGEVIVVNMVINQLTRYFLKIQKKRKIITMKKKRVNIKKKVFLVHIFIVVRKNKKSKIGMEEKNKGKKNEKVENLLNAEDNLV